MQVRVITWKLQQRQTIKSEELYHALIKHQLKYNRNINSNSVSVAMTAE